MRLRYVVGRLVSLLPVLLGITIMTFVISHVVPADPVSFAAGEKARPDQIEQLRKRYGLDQPLYVQYFDYLGKMAQGDLGFSMRSRRPVVDDLREYLPATVELASASMLLIVFLGIPLGVLSAVRQDSWLDHVTRVLAMIGVSMPVFWLGLLLQYAFYGQLHWLPVAGRLGNLIAAPPHVTGLYTLDSLLAGQTEAFASSLWHLVLPSLTLCIACLATVSRQVRSAMLDVLHQPFITTARSKGLSNTAVIAGHALRNAWVPVITVVALQTGSLLGGAVLTETVFAWPGLGYYGLKSVMALDYQPIMTVALLIAIAYTTLNLLADLLYVVVDPRVRS